MSDPRRLLEGDGDDVGLALLRAARRDRPGPHARRRTLAALGLGGAVVGAGATVTTVTAASTGGGLVLMKWIGLGVVSGLLFVGGVSYVSAPAAPRLVPIAAIKGHAARTVRSEAPPAAPAAPPPAEAAQAAPAAPPPAEAAQAAPAAPPAEPAAPPRAAAGAPPVEAMQGASALAEEVQILDGAREALAGSNPAAALAALERHNRRFGGGALGPEATVLRIEALLQNGDRAGAARLARAFLAAHPGSPHASRVRSLLPPAGGEAGRGEAAE